MGGGGGRGRICDNGFNWLCPFIVHHTYIDMWCCMHIIPAVFMLWSEPQHTKHTRQGGHRILWKNQGLSNLFFFENINPLGDADVGTRVPWNTAVVAFTNHPRCSAKTIPLRVLYSIFTHPLPYSLPQGSAHSPGFLLRHPWSRQIAEDRRCYLS